MNENDNNVSKITKILAHLKFSIKYMYFICSDSWRVNTWWYVSFTLFYTFLLDQN